MLKALELVGFKSFADKTRFEFPPGITVVVGPNGSGKSNIVDAIKWALGEQSAKSLRGKEMADVIFKGAASGARKAMNSAEATIVFDNSEGQLAIDSPEVHVSRRVYRSGEAEYLINRHPCRLRDVRDLCSGTGVGADAYAIIEQGKVDTLLQASARDRRAIFEEAAGISRFKAKKVETQRRLERVDQNLLRLADIVDEVEGRLKSVRAQAGKAQRYREYSQRLQDLRVSVGLVDWRSLSARLEEYEVELSQLRDESASLTQAVQASEEQSTALEAESRTLSEGMAQAEGDLSRAEQRVATLSAASNMQYRQLHELTSDVASRRERVSRLKSAEASLTIDVESIRGLLDAARLQYDTVVEELHSVEETAADLESGVEQLRKDREVRRQRHVELLKEASSLENSIGAIEAEVAAAQRRSSEVGEQYSEICGLIASQQQELANFEEEGARVAIDLQRKQDRLDVTQDRLSRQRDDLRVRQEALSTLQHRRAAIHERAKVLDELEKRYEGLNAGVKEVLSRARDEKEYHFRSVAGLVADVFQVDVQIATLIEIALGDAAHYVVLRDSGLVDAIEDGTVHFPGRVGLIELASCLPRVGEEDEEKLAEDGDVRGRADRFVETAAEFTPLVNQLLGDAWIVTDLAAARRLQRQYPRRRFVAETGEMLEADGRIYVGPRANASGIISRRSELRSLRDQLADLDEELAGGRSEIAALQDEIAEADDELRSAIDEHREASLMQSEHRARLASVQQQLEHLARDQHRSGQEQEAIRRQIEDGDSRLQAVRHSLAEKQRETADLERAADDDHAKAAMLESERAQVGQQATSLKIELAKSEQQVGSLGQQAKQTEQALVEKSQAITENRERLLAEQTQYQTLEREILSANGELAHLFLVREQRYREVHSGRVRRRTIETQRAEITAEAQRMRRELDEIAQRVHRKELAGGDLRHERGTLASRLLEDYGIEISKFVDKQDVEPIEDRQAVDEEIAELRRKVTNIGAVNVDALQELDELEQRFAHLSGQLTDLTEAKQSLEKIIHKINADSRRLFEETLATVRDNFRQLFRKVFGGGSADIILEEGVDVLEAGVDIVVTPPGKNTLHISLLSGGERALTAVTLLLAIFQFRPSPFCILDEVDGPLDEANIGRFVDVLKGFLDWTRFVIVTHSKATMAAASTLYGVTMQESGVSKRVSVQFDDVSEDGEISQAAVERDSGDAQVA
ncbi:chromosome segregation protein SMC [Blastopirellula sp. J2-11]|uniref:chromosome segregation protein SMC n=1 Tax=Blastopirellula sp. J2-11 TaxID=2943192 RepID=UPI0021CAD83D|nr:chromosome segregation protein SMC [Blastopirellula sp. J2-11]UUO04798.1 chromosome segregation protein SMC [Blastopirellula sp. J2-11]